MGPSVPGRGGWMRRPEEDWREGPDGGRGGEELLEEGELCFIWSQTNSSSETSSRASLFQNPSSAFVASYDLAG
jgi:hypothetical protein